MAIITSAKVETTLVEISAVMIAAGTSGLTIVSSLPANVQAIAATVCGGLITAGGSILAVWHKFVNVLAEVKAADAPAASSGS